MADYLLVVDMQSDYVAVGKAYHEKLTAAVNDKIATYPSDRVIYILNRFFWERKDRKKTFATDLLAMAVSRLPFWQLSRRIIRFLSICLLSELPTKRNFKIHCISGAL